MSINWAMSSKDGSQLVPLPQECIFYTRNGVRMELETGGGYPGNMGTFVGSSGFLFLTNQRVVFINKPGSTAFKSLSVPLQNLRDGVFKQPWFSSNVYEAVVIPVPAGGIPGPGQVKLFFKEGGGFEFSEQISLLWERLHESEGAPVEHLEELPTYHRQDENAAAAGPPPFASLATTTATSNSTTTPTATIPIAMPTPVPLASAPAFATIDESSSRDQRGEDGRIAASAVPTDMPPSYDNM